MSEHQRDASAGRLALSGLAAVLGLACSAAASAQDAQRLATRSLAATCAHCHGTEGQALAGQAMVRLAGLPADFTLTQLLAFRAGTRPSTIMHQLSRGYSQEQLEALAKYFAAQK